MSSYSPMGPQNIMETQNDENRPQSTGKNHWVIKLCPHIILISILLRVLVNKLGIMSVPLTLLWIWIGNRIQDDKIIVHKSSYIMLFGITFLDIANIYNNLPKVLDIYPWVREVMNWFTGLL